MTLPWRVASAVLVVSASMACAGVHARSQPEGPPLDVPPPPAVAVPVDAEAPAPAAQPSPASSGSRTVRRPAGKTPPKPPAPRKADAPDKTEPAPAAPAAPAKPASEAAAPAPSLQTTAKVGELEQRIRVLLTRAARDLDSIDVRTLSVDRRAQYDEARRFAEQAEGALKVKNLAFAEQLADKAATLAELLAKR